MRDWCLSLSLEKTARKERFNVAIDYFKTVNPYEETQLSEREFVYINRILRTEDLECFLSSLTQKREFEECFRHMIPKLESLTDAEWLPTEEDVIFTRQRTTGIIDHTIKIDHHLWQFVDAGGQKSEQKKWHHSIQNTNAIIYFVALDEFTLHENQNNQTCGFVASKKSWLSLVDSALVPQNTPVFLFFNKYDLFEKKLLNTKFSKYWKNYKGPDNNPHDIIKFIKGFYLNSLQHHDPNSIYIHVTTAVRKDAIVKIFDAVKNSILQQTLDMAGI